MSNQQWKGQKEAFQQALNYLRGRQKGYIKSIRTPWPKLDDAGVDGLEWHSMLVIAGRPGTGKTLIKDQIIRNIFPMNAGQTIRVLEFQLEMRGQVSAIREYSSIVGKSYKELCSAHGPIDEEYLSKCYEYAKERTKYPIDIVEEPPTVQQFKQIVTNYMEAHSVTGTDGKKVYVNTVITLDHSLLLEIDKKVEKDATEMLYNLGKVITYLKRRYPICFIILSQLNRNVDNPERMEEGRPGNYIFDSDIFGGDALLQHTDMLIGLNKPSKHNIKFYGPQRYIIEDDTLVWHFLKVRNGDPRMSFFRTEYNKMQISEMATPGTQPKRLRQ